MFLHLYSPPICLYVKGDIRSIDINKSFLISIVGSRKTTSYGRKMAFQFGRELAETGCIVVSGMANGIDGEAHWGAINAGGRTLAILGCGVEVIYPWENKNLYEKILSTGGLVMSEFPPKMEVRKGYFITRNRLVSGISKGTVVVEGTMKSGALITARYALEQGKDIFALPGNVASLTSQGPNNLIQNGAKLITSTEDILEEYNYPRKNKDNNRDLSLLEKDEITIYQKILNEPMTIDMLCQSLNLRINQLLPSLSSLELKKYNKKIQNKELMK